MAESDWDKALEVLRREVFPVLRARLGGGKVRCYLYDHSEVADADGNVVGVLGPGLVVENDSGPLFVGSLDSFRG